MTAPLDTTTMMVAGPVLHTKDHAKDAGTAQVPELAASSPLPRVMPVSGPPMKELSASNASRRNPGRKNSRGRARRAQENDIKNKFLQPLRLSGRKASVFVAPSLNAFRQGSSAVMGAQWTKVDLKRQSNTACISSCLMCSADKSSTLLLLFSVLVVLALC
jgi:hypothetical protein